MKILLSILAVIPYCLANKFAFDVKTQTFRGSYDDYSEDLLNSRIVETNSTFAKELFDGEPLNLNLGIDDWGPISTNLLMTDFPKDYSRPSPPCTISNSDLSYHLVHEKLISKIDAIYDYVIHKNSVWV
jgi:hypothetical protein